MGILDILGSEGIKKQLFKKMAQTAKENGFKKVLITIGENGEFDAKPFADDFVLIDSTTYNFLTNFYEKNKPKF